MGRHQPRSGRATRAALKCSILIQSNLNIQYGLMSLTIAPVIKLYRGLFEWDDTFLGQKLNRLSCCSGYDVYRLSRFGCFDEYVVVLICSWEAQRRQSGRSRPGAITKRGSRLRPRLLFSGTEHSRAALVAAFFWLYLQRDARSPQHRPTSLARRTVPTLGQHNTPGRPWRQPCLTFPSEDPRSLQLRPNSLAG